MTPFLPQLLTLPPSLAAFLNIQDKINSFALNNISATDTDFDGDEIYLEDLWQQTIHVPKVCFVCFGVLCCGFCVPLGSWFSASSSRGLSGLHHAAQDALKKLGLKVKFDEKGESEVVEIEGGAVAEVGKDLCDRMGVLTV